MATTAAKRVGCRIRERITEIRAGVERLEGQRAATWTIRSMGRP
jgi:hypothetical protein